MTNEKNKENKEDNIISLDELVKKSSNKIITDYDSVREGIIEAGGKTVGFDYKPLKKKTFLKAQATKDEEKIVDIMLTNTLWNRIKGKFWTLKEINEGIPPLWQTLLLAKIVNESGYDVSDLDVNF